MELGMWGAIGLSGLIAFLAGFLLLLNRSAVARLLLDRNDNGAVQASHFGEPLRLGGLAILAGMFAGAWMLSAQSAGHYTILLLLSTLPVFLAGLSEDSGRLVAPKWRLAAAVVSASVAVMALGLWVPRADLPGLDWILGFSAIAIVVTVLFASGFCHALNLIDGMNGLAAAVIILSTLGLGMIAGDQGLTQISALAYLIGAGALGFMLLNWPNCHLMLGDAGAYGLGHVVAWLAISIAALASNVAIPALLLVLFWPLADTTHTILRRLAAGRNVFEPDRMHLHQKLRRGLEIVFVGRHRRDLSNPLTTLILAPLIAVPVLTGVALAENALAAWLVLAAYASVFGLLHLLAASYARRYRKRCAALKPTPA